MPKIDAAQFVYFRADDSLSWIKKAGFQTVAASKEIPRSLLQQEIEPRLYMDPNSSSAKKLVYFSTSDGRVVVSQATRVRETGSDQRLGHYFHHGVVLHANDFRKVDCDPSRLWPQVKFLESAPDALAMYGALESELPHVGLNCQPAVDQAEGDIAHGWDGDTWNTAIALALASESIDRSNPLCAVGSLDEILNFVRQMVSRMSLQMRASCFFDTDFTGMQGHSIPNWLVGYPQSPNLRGRNIVDLQEKQVSYLRKSLETTSLYQAWQRRTSFSSARDYQQPPSGDSDSINIDSKTAEVVWSVSRIVEGVDRESNPHNLGRNSTDELEHLWQNELAIIWPAYKHALSKLIGVELAQRCGQSLFELQSAPECLVGIQGSWEWGLIVDCLWGAYAQESVRFAAAESGELLRLIEVQPDANCLAVWWLLFNQKFGELAPFLTNLDPRQYVEFTERAMKWPGVPIQCLLVENHALTFKEVANRLKAVTPKNLGSLQIASEKLGLKDFCDEWQPTTSAATRNRTTRQAPQASKRVMPGDLTMTPLNHQATPVNSQGPRQSLAARTASAIFKFFHGR